MLARTFSLLRASARYDAAMRQRGFLGTLAVDGWLGDANREFAREWYQSSDIQDLERQTAAQGAAQTFTHAQVEALRRNLVAQRAELDQLRTLVKVLCETLIDVGVISDNVLDYRLEAALDEQAAARAAAAAGGAPVAAPLVCEACNSSVPAARTVVTARGVVCDACHARLG